MSGRELSWFSISIGRLPRERTHTERLGALAEVAVSLTGWLL